VRRSESRFPKRPPESSTTSNQWLDGRRIGVFSMIRFRNTGGGSQLEYRDRWGLRCCRRTISAGRTRRMRPCQKLGRNGNVPRKYRVQVDDVSRCLAADATATDRFVVSPLGWPSVGPSGRKILVRLRRHRWDRRCRSEIRFTRIRRGLWYRWHPRISLRRSAKFATPTVGPGPTLLRTWPLRRAAHVVRRNDKSLAAVVIHDQS